MQKKTKKVEKKVEIDELNDLLENIEEKDTKAEKKNGTITVSFNRATV